MRKMLAVPFAAAAIVGLAASPAMAAVQNDLLVYKSSQTEGSADGFVGKGAYKNGARVHAVSRQSFEQDCVREQETRRGTVILQRDAVAVVNTSKEVTHTDRKNPKLKLTGYNWVVSGLTQAAPEDICGGAGWAPVGPAEQTGASAKVLLKDVTSGDQLLDTSTGAPIEVALW